MSHDVRFGVVLQGVDEPDQFIALVRRVEALGFDYLWLTDSSLHARYVYSYLTLAAMVTTRLKIGTSVTNPLTRHPAIGALAISTIDEISGGRAIYGIGAGDRPVEALGFKPARLATLRTAVEVTRRLLAGETVTQSDPAFCLDDAHMRVPTRADIPVYISASGPRTLELAGEIADGVIVLSGLFKEGLDYAMTHIKKGESRSGRKVQRAVFAYGALDEDAARAVDDARSIAAWFCQTAPVYCSLAGMSDELVQQVRLAYDGGEFQEAQAAARLIPDDMVRKMAFAGSPADGIEKVRDLIDAGVDCINFFPLGANRIDSIEAFGSKVIPAFRQVSERAV